MWSVEWADYRYHQYGMKKPPTSVETFHDRASAEARRAELRSHHGDAVVITVRPLVIKQKGLQSAIKNQRGDRFNSQWKLHS